jgi:hypothetical protein
MAFNKKELDQSFKSFSIDGFIFKKEIMGYSWTKEYSNRKEKIIIGYRGYPDSYVIYTPTVDIYFNEVENIINPLLDEFNIQNRYGNTTIQKSLIKIEGVDYSKLETEINNQSTFDMVTDEINKIISLGAMPFFEKYTSLKTVNEDLTEMSEDELSNFISGIIGVKLPLIKKLTYSSDFKTELLERNAFYIGEAFKYPQYFKDHEKVFDALFSEDLKAV